MKKFLTIALAIFLFNNTAKSQCSVTVAPTQNCSLGDQIDAFMFAGVGSTNSSGCSSAGYGNYTLTTFSAQIGAVISWSSTTNGYYYGQGFAVWIDLNNNNIYESSEQVISSAPSNVHSGTFAIPFSAQAGVNLRMRVRCAADASISNNQACTNNLGFGDGETEDYSVFLTCPSTTATIPSPTVILSNRLNPVVCLSNSISLTALGLSTYTWSGGISNGVAFTPAATSNYTVTAGVTGCPSATSTAVQGVTVISTTPTLSTTNSSLICSGNGTLTSTSNGGINWYATPTSTTLLGSGNTFTAFAASTTTYYAEALTLGGSVSQTFTHTGAAESFIVPSDVTTVQLETWGAEGGGVALSGNTSSGPGGKGGYATGILNVTPGSTLNIFVGGHGLSSTTGTALGGFNGGGQGHASSSFEPGNGGGGASDVRYLGNGLANRVIVAGGGGGGGEDSGDDFGDGGGLTGVGYSTTYDASQTAAGTGGGLGFGGGTGNGDGGGGGGGLYGGGTFSTTNIGTDTQGGGGGSGYVGGVTGATVLIAGNASMPNPVGSGSITGNSGHGYVRITYQEVCQISARVPAIINVTGAPTVAVNSGSVCSGGSFTITPSGASSYTIQGGSNIVSPTANTNYTVIGSNAGCVSANTATSSVTVNANPTITVNSGAICAGQTFTISPSGANTYTVQGGSNTVSPANTTSYSVTGTSANGCVSSSVAISNVTVNPNPTVTALSNPSILCVGESATITANGANTYTWDGGSNSVSIVVTPTISTSYTVTGSNANNCSAKGVITQSVSECTGIAGLEQEQPFSLYPNPNAGEFTIVSKGDMKLTLINELGQHIQTITLNESNEHSIQLNNIANGIYFITGVNNNEIIKQKVIVSK